VLGTDDSVEFTGIEEGAELDTGPVTSPDENGGVPMIKRLPELVGDLVTVELTQVIWALDGLSLEFDDSREDVGGLEDSSDEVVGLDALTLLLGMPEIVAEELSVLLGGDPPPVLGNPVELMLDDSKDKVGGLEDPSEEVLGLDALTLLLGMPENVGVELSVLLGGDPPPVLGNPVELMLEDELSGTDEEADDSQSGGGMIQEPVPLGTDGVVKLKIPDSTTDDVSGPGPEIRGLGLSQPISDELGQDGVITSVMVIVLEAVTVT
jgi:hypothetical protein